MDYDLQKVLDFDDGFNESFEEIGNKFIPILASSEYPVTSQTLIGLMATTNSVKLGIYDLAEACDTHLYIIKILHRTLIEHYLKFYYILFRFINDSSDEVGIEYRKYSRISEALAFINASSVSSAMIGKSTESQILKQLKKDHPEFEISKKELNEITYKWKHRSIVKYIKNNTSIIQNERSYLLKLIPEYAELSSFIHGGTFAEQYYHDVFNADKLKQIVFNEVFEAAFMAASMKMHLMLAVIKIDNSFSSDMLILAKLVGDFLEQKT